MYIQTPGNWCFVCIPKCASLSIRKALTGVCGVKRYDQLPEIETPPASAYLVAFVRNPYDRLHSCWKHWVRDRHHHRMQVHGIDRSIPFPEFVRIVSYIPDERADMHFRSQASFLPRPPDFLGRVETLTEDWRQLPGLPSIGHSNGRLGPDPYDEATRQLAGSRYANDFTIFGYQP